MGVIAPVGFGIAKLRWKMLTIPDEMIATFGYSNVTTDDPNVHAGDVFTAFTAAGRPCATANFSSRYQWLGVECTFETTTGPVTGQVTVATTGTGASGPLPPNSAYLVRKFTARGGRMGRGRMFIPPIHWSDSDIDEFGVITAATFNTIRTAYNDALTALIASPSLPVLLHSDGSTPNSITSWTLQQQICTQRRRLRR